MATKNNKITPLMQQYFTIKKEYENCLLLFQVGDFYELFFDDAKQAAAFLAIALTKRGKNNGEDVPLCGIPVHALGHYLRKLIKGGFNVAICDQLEKPQAGKVVKRGVTQVFTPGTLTDSLMLDDKTASYMLSFFPGENDMWGLLFTELLTAQLFATTIPAGADKTLESELVRFLPDEVIIPATAPGKPFFSYFKKRSYCASFAPLPQHGDIALEPIPTAWFEAQFKEKTRQQLQQAPELFGSLATMYHYLKKNHERALNQLRSIHFYAPEDYLILDAATQKNLEVISNNQNGTHKNTLFAVLDKAKTAMGSRTVKKWLQRPLVQKEAIQQRQEVVTALLEKPEGMQRLEEQLGQIADLERIVGRIALERATHQDYLALKTSITLIPQLKQLLTTQLNTSLTSIIQEKLHNLATLHELLESSLHESATNGELIKQGFDQQLDQLKHLLHNGKQELLTLEANEIKKTGINSLKIRYNNVSGYYIEITNPNLAHVPERYLHVQTLANRKRFTSQELKELEQALYKAEHNLNTVEQEVYERVKREVAHYLTKLRHVAQAVAYLDGLFSLANSAYTNQYVKPTLNDAAEIIITGGRHPVIEVSLQQAFVCNNTQLTQQQQLLVITGPNMGGKSTYLRQVALICLMAQCGSFVPAQHASLPLLDRIFTRIGSADNLAEGKSTFLVEMEETATICTQATNKSLVILDEVGRGTSTSDGIALAQAIIEYLVTTIHAKCLFATHYHELTALAQQFSTIKNYHLQCKKEGSMLHFLHTIEPGIAHQSFGLDVAKLAQLPTPIIKRAKEILQHFNNTNNHNLLSGNTSFQPATFSEEKATMSREYDDLVGEIKNKDIDNLTPKQALDFLWELQKKL